MKQNNLDKVINLPFLKNFLARYSEANMYLVGGSVRDIFLNRDSEDFDLVADGVSSDDLASFLKEEGRVVNVFGRAFGVVKFKPRSSDLILDIALPRRESYVSGKRRKYAEVEVGRIAITDDLSRRDFTINAMALDLRTIITRNEATKQSCIKKGLSVDESALAITISTDCLIDPYGGLNDLNNKIIRTVGPSNDRFLEDPTRILRGVRFSVQFGFRIDEETFLSMKRLSLEITKEFKNEDGIWVPRVSWEMIGSEFSKSFNNNPEEIIKIYNQIGLLTEILPEVDSLKGVSQPQQFHAEGDVFVHTLLALSHLPQDTQFEVKLATLLHDIGKASTFQSAEATGDRIRFNNHAEVGAIMARDICRRFHFSKRTVSMVSWMIENHMKVFYSFLKMRKEKQKAFVRNQYFGNLMILAEADTLASIAENGKADLSNYLSVKKLADEIRSEDLKKPREIMSGSEIINLLKEKNFKFDPKKHGRYVGDIKKNVNTLYDRGEIESKNQAISYIRKLIDGQKR